MTVCITTTADKGTGTLLYWCFPPAVLTLGNHFSLTSWSHLKGACQERRW